MVQSYDITHLKKYGFPPVPYASHGEKAWAKPQVIKVALAFSK